MNGSIAQTPNGSGLLIIRDLNQIVDDSAATPVLELAVTLTHSDAAHLYWLDPASHELRLFSASSTSEEGPIQRISLQFSPASREWLESLLQPEILRRGDAHFASFPETVRSAVSGLLIVPLLTEDGLGGVLTLSRNGSYVYAEASGEIAAKLGIALLAAMMERQREQEVEFLHQKLRSARQENSLLEKRLAERKLVERAKGILQTQYGWNEEDAYYHLRRTSRQQRTPMAVIAQRVIDVSSAKETERELLSA